MSEADFPDPEDLQVDEDSEEPVPIADLEGERDDRIAWDAKTRQMMRRILTQKVDLPISRLREMIDEGEIDLAPDFQRRHRWSRPQQSRLIESVIMNVPIPPVFLGEDEPGRYVVLDGRQRLTALYQFLSNQLRLTGLEVWSELNGKRFKQLKAEGADSSVASAVTRRFVPAILILHESVPDVKYEVFDRLNTGGVIAEPMEVRNAIYRGGFNQLLHEVTTNPSFRTLWGIPLDDRQRLRNAAYKKMADLEMALRFFAFQRYQEFNGSIKSFLNQYMEDRNAAYEKDPELKERDRAIFERTMDRTQALLGAKALHRPTGPGELSRFPSAPLADAVLYAISRLPEERDRLDGEADRLRGVLEDLCLNDRDFLKAITEGTNARTAVQDRIEKATRRVLDLDANAPIP